MFSFIGKLITQMREEHQMSMADLSSKSGVTLEKLEEIESGKVTPSIGVMIRLSRALGSRLGTLLDGQENVGAVVTRARRAVSTENPVSTVATSDSITYTPLAGGKSDRHMEPFIIEVDSNNADRESFSEHEGEEFLYVLDGTVELHYGAEVHRIDRGDSIYYDCIVPHKIINENHTPAKLLAVVYTPL